MKFKLFILNLLQSPTGLTKVCELLEAKHGTLDVCTMLALQTKQQQQQQQQSENSPSVPHVEGISSDDISGSSSSFHYCYYYAVGFVTTLFTSLSAKLSTITIDWGSLGDVFGVGFLMFLAFVVLEFFLVIPLQLLMAASRAFMKFVWCSCCSCCCRRSNKNICKRSNSKGGRKHSVLKKAAGANAHKSSMWCVE